MADMLLLYMVRFESHFMLVEVKMAPVKSHFFLLTCSFFLRFAAPKTHMHNTNNKNK